MAGTINIQVGPTSNLLYAYRKELLETQESLANKSLTKALCVDFQSQFPDYNIGKIFALNSSGKKDVEISKQIGEPFSHKKSVTWMDKINFDENLRSVRIQENIQSFHKLSGVFDSLNFIDGSNFSEDFEEEARHLCEGVDLLENFTIISETYNSFSLASLVIMDKLADHFGSKRKMVIGLWDCDPLDSSVHAHQLFLNSLFSIEILDHKNTLLIPFSPHMHIGKHTSIQTHDFNNWSEFDQRLDLNNVHQQCRFFAYLINTFVDAFYQDRLSISDAVDIFQSTVWGSSGSMAGFSYHLFAPLPPTSHVFKQLNDSFTNFSNRSFSCLSPGFSGSHPQAQQLAYQLVSLNDHPSLHNNLLQEDISKYRWKSSLSRQFNPDSFTKKDMLQLYLDHTFQSVLNRSSTCSQRFLKTHNSNILLYFPSLTFAFTGQGHSQCLLQYMSHMRETPTTFLKNLSLNNFDFSSDSIERYLNKYNLKCEALDPLALLKSNYSKLL